MKDMHVVAGISKQSLWKHQKQLERKALTSAAMVAVMNKIRRNHSRMGCRSMFYAAREPLLVGRDLFEKIGFANGFKLRIKRNKAKTTWSQRVEVFPNLIEGRNVTRINQVWQSDIFYLKVENEHYYGVTIVDVYSRKLLALHLSKSLEAKENVKALKKAFKARKGHGLRRCILHSDRGSQYISQAHKDLLKSKNMRMSMCKMPQENAYVERIQGTIRHQYLCGFNLTKANLAGIVRRIISRYNDEKPHIGLKMKTPSAFEAYVEKLPKAKRPNQVIYKGYSELSTNKALLTKRKR